jgi:hypothetical protein
MTGPSPYPLGLVGVTHGNPGVAYYGLRPAFLTTTLYSVPTHCINMKMDLTAKFFCIYYAYTMYMHICLTFTAEPEIEQDGQEKREEEKQKGQPVADSHQW